MEELRKRIHDDSNGLDYILVGDYYIPDLKLPEESRPIGRWGRMHKSYLQEHRPGQYNELLLSGKLWTYLADLNQQAADRLACIISQMQAAEGVTEELKARDQLAWAEAMTIYRSGHYSMKFSKSIQRQLVEVQKDFMPEDTEAGQIQGFLEHYTGSMVCSKQLFKEALGHTYDEPKRWQLHNINEIMNTVVTGWKPFSNPRMFAGYGRQRGWERDVSGNELPGNEDGFVELSEEECRQLELPKEWIA